MKKQHAPKPSKQSPIQIIDLAPSDLKQVVGGQAPKEEARK
jgi:hypothetical protein